MYLFGDHDPEVAALLGKGEFGTLVEALFAADAAGGLARPADLPSFWNDALRLELLASPAGDPGGPGETGRYAAGRRLVLIPAAAERGAADRISAILAHYVEVAREVGDELRAVYPETAAAARFAWPQVSHTVIAGLFLDLAMGRQVQHSGQIPRHAAGETAVWAFEGISANNAFGVRAVMAEPPRRALFGELWHHRTRRSEARLSPAMVEALARIAEGNGAGAVGGAGARELLYLKHLKLARTVEGALQLQFPAFGTADTERLLGPLTEGAGRLVEEAVLPALELLGRAPWWREAMQDAACRHAAVRLILEYGIDRTIAAGVCEPFPAAEELPVTWGRWLWEEPLREEADTPRTLLPHLAAPRPGEAHR